MFKNNVSTFFLQNYQVKHEAVGKPERSFQLPHFRFFQFLTFLVSEPLFTI